jgi:hypothetical protein
VSGRFIRLAAVAASAALAPAMAAESGHDHGAHAASAGHESHDPAPLADPHAGHMGHNMTSLPDPHAGHVSADPPADHAMRGAFGSYAMGRDASGTAWQPDTSRHGGIHLTSGEWMFMVHALLNGVYDTQEGPRGDDKAYLAGMVMGMARRDFEHGTLQFRAMLSPDPFMGKSGYPLLLASGETADGITPLIDRQHPHDLFMELSASYSHRFDERTSVFIYGGLPGEPAFGPPAFMHRQSILDSPEAPITHHWLDSTHITFGVITAGLVLDNLKIEASRFHGREPDEERYDIETGDLDSSAVRFSWNPLPELSLQVSWAEQISPEQLHPEDDTIKWSASAIYTRPFGEGDSWSVTTAWGRRVTDGVSLDAALIEGSVSLDDRWTVFGRAEWTQNNELEEGHGEAFEVGKASLGVIYDFRLSEDAKLGLGGLYAVNFIPDELEHDYGGNPGGAMAFVRLKVE